MGLPKGVDKRTWLDWFGRENRKIIKTIRTIRKGSEAAVFHTFLAKLRKNMFYIWFNSQSGTKSKNIQAIKNLKDCQDTYMGIITELTPKWLNPVTLKVEPNPQYPSGGFGEAIEGIRKRLINLNRRINRTVNVR